MPTEVPALANFFEQRNLAAQQKRELMLRIFENQQQQRQQQIENAFREKTFGFQERQLKAQENQQDWLRRKTEEELKFNQKNTLQQQYLDKATLFGGPNIPVTEESKQFLPVKTAEPFPKEMPFMKMPGGGLIPNPKIEYHPETIAERKVNIDEKQDQSIDPWRLLSFFGKVMSQFPPSSWQGVADALPFANLGRLNVDPNKIGKSYQEERINIAKLAQKNQEDYLFIAKNKHVSETNRKTIDDIRYKIEQNQEKNKDIGTGWDRMLPENAYKIKQLEIEYEDLQRELEYYIRVAKAQADETAKTLGRDPVGPLPPESEYRKKFKELWNNSKYEVFDEEERRNKINQFLKDVHGLTPE